MKRPRLTSTQGVLLCLGTVLVVLVGSWVVDVNTPLPRESLGKYEVAFDNGGAAPDFELPDSHGTMRRLSKLVKNRTVVSFVSNDQRSRDLMRYLGMLRKRMRKHAPLFIAVADFPPAQEAAFRRATGLDQLFLYEARERPVAQQYKAVPTPRYFQIDRGLQTAFVGPSVGEDSLYHLGASAGEMLKFRSPHVKPEFHVPAGMEPPPVAPDPAFLDQTMPAAVRVANDPNRAPATQ